MSDTAAIDPSRTAVLALDFLTPILQHYASDGFAPGDVAARVVDVARAAGCAIGHVTPSMMVDHGRPLDEAVDFYPPIRPAPGDARFLKDRIGAFASTGLDLWLRQSGRDTLVLMGVATSGTVLSTTRWAFDVGFRTIVVTDGCSDPDPQMHDVLTRPTETPSWIGLWKIAELITADEIIGLLGPVRPER